MIRLLVKRGDSVVNEHRFSRGPVYIGRQIGSQIFLPDKAVSRQHTVIYTTTEGQWIVEDLDSANKTYLNSDAVHKAEIKSGDIIQVADFNLEVFVEESAGKAAPLTLDETLHATLHEPQTVIRRPETEHAPMMRMAAKRVKDFAYAATTICAAKNLKDIAATLLAIARKQFSPFHIWIALRDQAAGPMTITLGKARSGVSIKLEALPLAGQVTEAVKEHQHILIPRMPLQSGSDKINSAIIVPLLTDGSCYGVIYIDNSADHEHYSMSDMDYLILISIQAAAVIKSF